MVHAAIKMEAVCVTDEYLNMTHIAIHSCRLVKPDAN